MQIRRIAVTNARIVMKDLAYAITHERTVQIMLVLLLFSIICWHMPIINWFLYPFKLFVTTVHEACHALMARVTGGQVGMIVIEPNEEGLTMTIGGIAPLVTMAGYIGTAIFGGLLIWWGRTPNEARFVLQSIGICILALTAFYAGGSMFSFVSMLLIGLGILLIARKTSSPTCHTFLLFLAVQTTLNAVISIQDLFLISALSERYSDARNMESITGVPAIIWSLSWGLIAISILTFSLWISYKPRR